MTNYDLKILNDKEFEDLVADLISSLENTRVERFKPGRDKGVDGRFFSSDGGEVIIQCKHYERSGYGRLIKHLKTVEAQKVERLKPKRYIFATSVELSRVNKKGNTKYFFSIYKIRDRYIR